MDKFNLIRVSYGKKDTPFDKREFKVKELSTSAVGTVDEIAKFLKDLGYNKVRLICHDTWFNKRKTFYEVIYGGKYE